MPTHADNPASFERYVLFSEEKGVYLGSFAGLGFWTKVDTVGQDFAVAFDTPEEGAEWMQSWETPVPDAKPVRVTLTADRAYASIDECVAAGLPRWTP